MVSPRAKITGATNSEFQDPKQTAPAPSAPTSRVPTWLLLLTSISLLLARPGFLGEYLGSLYLALAIVQIVVIGLAYRRLRVLVRDRRFPVIVCVCFSYWLFRLLQAVTLDISSPTDIIKGMIMEIVSVLLFSLICCDSADRDRLHRLLCIIVAALGLSSFISMLMSLNGFADHIRIASLHRTRIDITYEYIIQFPFSVLYGEWTGVSGNTLFRYTGGFAEAGIYPAFAGWAICFSLMRERRSWLVSLGCLVGIIASGSTNGLLILGSIAFGLTLYLIFYTNALGSIQSRLIAAPLASACILTALTLVLLYAPDIGLSDKNDTHAISTEERVYNIRNALERLPINLLGTASNEQHASICLLAATFQLGLLGTLLWGLKCVALTSWFSGSIVLRFVLLAPLFLTLLFSQPLYDSMPAVILLLFSKAE